MSHKIVLSSFRSWFCKSENGILIKSESENEHAKEDNFHKPVFQYINVMYKKGFRKKTFIRNFSCFY